MFQVKCLALIFGLMSVSCLAQSAPATTPAADTTKQPATQSVIAVLPAYLLSEARAFYRKGDFDAAIAKYQEFLKDHPQVQLHFTPTYSSWLNQVEIWFARIEREVIARGVFTSVRDLARKLIAYIRAYSKTARPFKWKYSDVRRRVKAC